MTSLPSDNSAFSNAFTSFFQANAKPLKFLRHVEGDAEYYTDRQSGVSGMSQSGLAQYVGKSHQSLNYWVRKVKASDPASNKLSEPLKPFAGQVLSLANKTDSEGADVLPDTFCSAMVLYYACFAAPKDQTDEAKMSLVMTSAIGMRAHIQQKTGWKPDVAEEVTTHPVQPMPNPDVVTQIQSARTVNEFCRVATTLDRTTNLQPVDREFIRAAGLRLLTPQSKIKAAASTPQPQQLDLLNQPQDPFVPHNWDYSFGVIESHKDGKLRQILLIDRVRQLGYEPTALQMGKIAMRCVVRFYWDNRRLPAMHGGYLGFESFIYDETDLPLIDQVIHNELEDGSND